MHIQFAELPVFHQDRAKAFYIEHFGCHVTADQPMEPRGWRWIELQFPDAQTTLHFLPTMRSSRRDRFWYSLTTR
jgi:catechol 2,3-dioxygenase-like lactoylglutathione lyase family enzyme